MREKKLDAFTLIEILLAIALVAILATITIVAINPGKNFASARNAQRSSDVGQILNAVTQYTSEEGQCLDNDEDLDGTVGTGETGCTNPMISGTTAIPLCTGTAAAIGTGSGNIDLSTNLVDEYIVEIPQDPSDGTAEDTGYTICKTSGGRIEISAPSAENGQTVTVKR
jgi:type IV pilus assembly protein PilA